MVRFNLNLASGEHLKRRTVLLVLYSAMVVLALFIGFDVDRFYRVQESEAAFDQRVARLLSEKQLLQKEIGRMGRDPSADSIKALQKEIAFFNELIHQRGFSWTSFLSDLEKRVPADVSVTRIQPDFRSGVVILGGASRSLGNLTEFVGNLQKGPPFEEVFLIDQERFKEKEKEGLSFSIRFKYETRENQRGTP